MNKKSRLGWILIGILLLTLTGLAERNVLAQTDGEREYFPSTGHWVLGEFLTKYHSVPNPGELFGNPITEAFQDEVTGLTVQYFDKVRFELHPDEIPDLRVKLSNLGSFIYKKGQTLPVPFSSSGCRFYPQVDSGYYICYDFLGFFDENGGVTQFGYPISNFEMKDGWIVQYFQRARFEWHPENVSGNWVQVSNLGTKYFFMYDGDPGKTNPKNQDNIPLSSVNQLRARAFVGTPIVPSTGNQTLYVFVHNQNHNPVADAQIRFQVKYPDGQVNFFEMNATNRKGFSTYRFPYAVQSNGTVEIEVTVRFQSLEDQTKTSFQVWW